LYVAGQQALNPGEPQEVYLVWDALDATSFEVDAQPQGDTGWTAVLQDIDHQQRSAWVEFSSVPGDPRPVVFRLTANGELAPLTLETPPVSPIPVRILSLKCTDYGWPSGGGISSTGMTIDPTFSFTVAWDTVGATWLDLVQLFPQLEDGSPPTILDISQLSSGALSSKASVQRSPTWALTLELSAQGAGGPVTRQINFSGDYGQVVADTQLAPGIGTQNLVRRRPPR
jgi:hypothetical protein